MAEKKKELVTINLSERWLPEYRISTGVIAFDRVLNGGIPSGRLTELFGGESAYKSLVVLQILAEAAKDDKFLVVLADTEHSVEKGLVDMVGLDVSKLHYLDIDAWSRDKKDKKDKKDKMAGSIESIFDSLEAGLNKAYDLEKRLVFAWDSVAATPGYEDLVGALGRNEASMRRAKLLKSGLDKYMGRLAKANACFILVNQIQDKIGVQFGSKITTPGGRSIKHWASLRMRFRTIGSIKDENSKEKIATNGNLSIEKHKAGRPFGEVNFEQYVGEPLSKYTGLLDYMTRHGEIGQAGSYYYFPDDKENTFYSKDFPEIYEKRNKKEEKNGKH